MKRLIIIIGTILVIAEIAGLHEDSFTPQNPAHLANRYYSYVGVKKETFLIDDYHDIYTFEFFLFNATRKSLPGFFSIKSTKEPDDLLIFLSTSVPRRINDYFYSGVKAGFGWSFETGDLEVGLRPGLVFKPFNRYEVGFYSDVMLIKRDEFDYETEQMAELKFYFSNIIHNKAAIDSEKNLSYELSFSNNRNWLFFLRFEDILKNEHRSISAGINFRLKNFFSLNTYSRDFELKEELQHFNSRLSNLFILQDDIFSPPLDYTSPYYFIRKRSYSDYGLALKDLVRENKVVELEIVVQPDDNLTRISRNLPENALEEYKNNVQAIASYNNIKNVSIIRAGQVLKIPAYSKVFYSGLEIEDDKEQLISELLELTASSRYLETRVNSAYWRMKTNGLDAALFCVPLSSEVENIFLLNLQAVIFANQFKLDRAYHHLKWAWRIDSESAATNANLGLLYYLKQDNKKAAEFLNKSRALGIDAWPLTNFEEYR